jgi:hypothetical protein
MGVMIKFTFSNVLSNVLLTCIALFFLCLYRIPDILQKAFWLLLHPLCLLTLVVMTCTALTFPDEPVPELLERGVYGHPFRENSACMASGSFSMPQCQVNFLLILFFRFECYTPSNGLCSGWQRCLCKLGVSSCNGHFASNLATVLGCVVF